MHSLGSKDPLQKHEKQQRGHKIESCWNNYWFRGGEGESVGPVCMSVLNHTEH